MITARAALSLCLGLICTAAWAQPKAPAKSELPPGIGDASLGMTAQSFLASRPTLRKRYESDPERRPLDAGQIFFEELSSRADFELALYHFVDGKLVAISLYAGGAPNQPLLSRRASILKTARALWGAPKTASLVTLDPGTPNERRNTPQFVWDHPTITAILWAPEIPWQRNGRSWHALLHIIARAHAEELAPRLPSEPVPEATQRALFKAAGLTQD